MCSEQNVTNRPNRQLIQPLSTVTGVLCPFTAAPLPPASASVRSYIRVKSCTLTPDDNFKASAVYVSLNDIRSGGYRYGPKRLM
jgi:hypothetical protein